MSTGSASCCAPACWSSSSASARCIPATTIVWSVRHTITARSTQDEVRAGAQRRRPAAGMAAAAGLPGGMTDADDTTRMTMLDVLERLRNRFYGKYRGVVTDVDAATMRIKAKVPAVLGRPDHRLVQALRALRRAQRGLRLPAGVGAGVWIEFEGGDVSYPIWTGCYWRDGEMPSDAAAEVKTIVTKRRPQDSARRRRGHDHDHRPNDNRSPWIPPASR